MNAFWEDDILVYSGGNLVFKRCSNCKEPPLEWEEQEVLSPYCPWCGFNMTNAEEG